MQSDFVATCTNDDDTPVYFCDKLQHINGNASNLASIQYTVFFRKNILCTLPVYAYLF